MNDLALTPTYHGSPTTTLEFAEATGWPEEEWMDLTMSEAAEILELYGLKFSPEVERFELASYFGYIDGWNAALRAVESGEGARYRTEFEP